jgi:hypothetical protein
MFKNFFNREDFACLSKSNFHLLRNSHPMWAASLKLGYKPFYHWFQAYQSTQISLNRLEHKNGSFVWFSQNRMVRFWKLEYPVSAVLTLLGVKLTPSLPFSPNSQEQL